MQYINMKGLYGTETVDQFETYSEAREMVKEYNYGDYNNHYYISQRCCKDWKENSE